MMRFLISLLAALSAVQPSHAAFSDKPIRIVVAFAPGSSTDTVARLVGEQLASALAELLALASTSKMAYASSGNGTATQLGAEWLFRGLAKVDITHIPYQPAAATHAVVSGQVPIASTSMPPAVPFAKTGKVRPIAVMSLKRSPALPDVPTVAELGYKDFEANTRFALFAPAKTPPAVLDLLNAEVNKALGAKSLQERFETLSLEATRMDRPTLRRYIDGEVTKWGRLVKELGVTVQ